MIYKGPVVFYDIDGREAEIDVSEFIEIALCEYLEKHPDLAAKAAGSDRRAQVLRDALKIAPEVMARAFELATA